MVGTSPLSLTVPTTLLVRLKLSDSIPSKSSKIRGAINVKTWGVGRATLVLRQLGKEQRGVRIWMSLSLLGVLIIIMVVVVVVGGGGGGVGGGGVSLVKWG